MAIQTLTLPNQAVLHAGLTADDVDPPGNFGGHHKIFGRKVRCADTLQGGSLQWRAGSTAAGGLAFLEHWRTARCIRLAGWMGSLRCCFCSFAGHLPATLRLEQPHVEPTLLSTELDVWCRLGFRTPVTTLTCCSTGTARGSVHRRTR